MFARESIEIRRLALNMDQVERYRPPPNFCEGDGLAIRSLRRAIWRKKVGSSTPSIRTVIADLIRTEVEGLIDAKNWNAAKAQEDANRVLLDAASENWGQGRKHPQAGR